MIRSWIRSPARSDPPREQRTLTTLRRVWDERAPRDAVYFVAAILLLAGQAGARALVPLALRELIEVMPDLIAVYLAAAWFAALQLIDLAFRPLHRRFVARFANGLLHRLNVKLEAHLERLSLSFHTRTSAGEKLSPLTEDYSRLQAIGHNLSVLLSQCFSFVFCALVLLELDWRLALIAYLITPVALLHLRAFRKVKRIAKEEHAARGRLATLARELSDPSALIAMKTLGGSTFHRRFAEESKAIERHATSVHVQVGVAMIPTDLVLAGLLTSFYLFVAHLESAGRPISDGTIVVLATALTPFIYSLRTMFERLLEIVDLPARLERIFELLDTEPEIRWGTETLGIDAPAELRFQDVSFSYATGPQVLHDLTLHVPAGKTVAIVGSTGAGKSTVASLAVRLYDVTGGHVSVGGVDVRQLEERALQAHVGYVPQEPFIYDGTIADNIRFGMPDATDEQVREAARRALLDTFIARLPDGYATRVGTDGVELSGGQRQRIVLARMFLADYPIVVLDEATSALDSATQRGIAKELHELKQDRTMLVIAHRLSTVREADEIVVLDHGRIVERGRHEQLVARNERYAALVAAEQF